MDLQEVWARRLEAYRKLVVRSREFSVSQPEQNEDEDDNYGHGDDNDGEMDLFLMKDLSGTIVKETANGRHSHGSVVGRASICGENMLVS